MKLLAIDSATNACSAALWLGDGAGPRRYDEMQRGHAEALMPMVGEVMEEAGLDFSELDALAVTTGPGAFTGIRIGLAAARGFAVATGLPLVGVTTLEAVAAAQESGGDALLVALDSKRSDIYVQLFGADGMAQTPPAAMMPEAVGAILPEGAPVALAGDAAERVAQALADRIPAPRLLKGPALPDAAVVARLAVGRLADAPPVAGEAPPAALYLRPPDAVPAAQREAGKP